MSDEEDIEEPIQKVRSKRIFFNNVDTYTGKNIGQYLGQCVVGASLEDAEEEGEDDAGSVRSAASHKEGSYRVIGTLKDPNGKPPSNIAEIVNYNTREELLEKLLECDIIIYNINDDMAAIDEAVWSVSSLHTEIEHFDGPKMFILLSSVLTWAKSKPLDPDDPEIPFTEDDYRRRKPHPNFKEHISAEKIVIKFGKTNKQKFQTYVVASGLTYGMGENIFHFLYKTAWLGEASALQCFGTGTNIVPTIHIKDLASVLQNILDGKPKTRYLVAVDDSQNSLEEIVRIVSSKSGTGKVEHISKEDALLIKDLKQSEFDSLLVNLHMEAMFVKESMSVRWVAETGMVDAIDRIIKEYKETRGLLPMRACILGPPASGKSTIAAAVCKQYKLHHITIKDVIDETLERLEQSAARLEQTGSAAEEEEEDDGKAQEDSEFLEQVKEGRENNGGRIEDQHIIRFFREKLKSMPCQNQGFVLDGFPKTYEQAKDLFALEDEDEGDDPRRVSYDSSIMPEVVIALDAEDDFLKHRVMNLPEEVVQGTHNTEEGFLRRLQEYRSSNHIDDTVLNYFDELEIHPEHIDVNDKTDIKHEAILEKISTMMGEARNYGPTPEEKEEMERVAAEARMKKEAEEREIRERQEAEEAAVMKQRQEEWMERLEEVRRQEREVLEQQSIPLRNYLMKHVMPTLTDGLIQCCQVRPDDPVDYLAEFLFQQNPQVD
uniref:adenylate kinase 7 isoform X2 n=1 Tax=Ciona intestinalis TaxID=7719 RepID=UPI00089DC377|nr:adenylate kinase 7 isoform X2 [Ciona intestinalis]|eukprot:XP_018670747.1 adenylate kinase 7 isoform X2 [Ciona intestinalis]